MKLIKLSLLGLLSIFFFSCEKATEPLALKVNGPNVKDVAPTIAIASSVDPQPAFYGEEVTLYVATDATCGQIALERATVLAPGDTTWTALGSPKDVVDGQPLSFLFTPDALGYIGFRAHYTPSGGCKGFSQVKSPTYKLLVIKKCEGLKLEAKLISAKREAETNVFRFTAQYTISTCDETYTDGKLQGGLTAIASLESTNPASATVRQTNQNTIISWEESSLKGERIYTVTFTKELIGEAPYELTGNWSYKAYDKNGVLQTVGYDNALSFDGKEL